MYGGRDIESHVSGGCMHAALDYSMKAESKIERTEREVPSKRLDSDQYPTFTRAKIHSCVCNTPTA